MSDVENHILIVDDEPLIRKTLVDYFEEKHWVAHAANDGLQAIRSMRDFNPDIVLMDIRMPGRDGITTCNIIRKDITLNYDVPVIMMTAYHDKDQIVKSIEAGCNDFILKPFQFDVLFEKVEKLLEAYYKPTPKKEKDTTTH
jgi:DNA-binding response OmpR family regulator|tara:strand:+ start:138 stop:563 length:426 start_codon:yes stop_codon:yes gene_type:complete